MDAAEAQNRRRSYNEAQAALAEWRERLPEVWPVVPVVKPACWGTVPLLGAAVLAGAVWGAVLTGGAWAASSAIDNLGYRAGSLFQTVEYLSQIVRGLLWLILYFALLLIFWLRIARVFPSFYGRYFLPRAPSRRVAAWGTRAASLVSFLSLVATERLFGSAFPEWIHAGTLPQAPTDIMGVLGWVGFAFFSLMWLVLTTLDVADAPDGRRYCSECGRGLKVAAKKQTSVADAADTFGKAAHPGGFAGRMNERELALPEEDTDADYHDERTLFLLYECPACRSGILEGEADINLRCTPDQLGHRKHVRDRWRFLSVAVSQETVERLKAQIKEEHEV